MTATSSGPGCISRGMPPDSGNKAGLETLNPPASADTDSAHADTDRALTDRPLADTSLLLKETEPMPDETLVPQTDKTAPQPAPAASSQATAPARTAISNDILAACQAAGITSAKQLTERLSMATLGDHYAEEVRDDAKVQAIRACGAEVGQQCAASCEHLPVATVASMRDGWKAQADKAFGIGEDGQAPLRKTAPAAQKVAVPAEAGADAEAGASKWDKLSAAQRSQGTAMGMKTPEQREKFAANVLGTEKETN